MVDRASSIQSLPRSLTLQPCPPLCHIRVLTDCSLTLFIGVLDRYYQSWNLTRNVSVGAKTTAPVSLHENPFTFFSKFANVTSAYTSSHIKDDDQFYSDLANGVLPNVTWVKPDQSDGWGVTDNNPTVGNAKLQSYMNAIYASSYWQNNQMMVIVTFADGDGLYDHVPPYVGDFSGPGQRVPTIIVSPDHAGGKINSQPYETGSILKLIETRFGINDTLFSAARSTSTADLTKSFGDDAVTYTSPAQNIGALINFKAAPVSAIIEQTYVGCGKDVHSMVQVPLMYTVGGEKLQSSALIVNDVWLSWDGWNTAQPKGQTIMADGTGNVMPRRASSTALLQNGNIVWLGGKNGTTPVFTNLVTYSTDYGTTWYTATQAAAWTPRSDQAVCVLPKTNYVIAAGGVGAAGGGIVGANTFLDDVWVSTDGIGAVWTQVNSGNDVPYHGGSCIGFYDSATINPTLYTQTLPTVFLVSSYATGNYRSIDGGATWETLPVPWPEPTNGNGGGIVNARIFMSLAVDYDNVLYVLGGSLGEYRNDVWSSTTKGSTWSQLVLANVANDPYSPFYIEVSCLAVSYVPASTSNALVKQLVIYSGTQGLGQPNNASAIVAPSNVYNNASLILNPSTLNYTLYAQILTNLANPTATAAVATVTYAPTQVYTNNVTVAGVPTLSSPPASAANSSFANSATAGALPTNSYPSCAFDANSKSNTPLMVYLSTGSNSPTNVVYTSQNGFTSTSSITAATPSSSVPAVSGAGLVIIASNSAILLLGGISSSVYSNAVYASPDGSNWTTVASSGALWSPRAGASVCTAPGSNVVFVVGGVDATGAQLSDTWSTNAAAYTSGSGLTWTQQSSTGPPALSYSAPCVAFNSSTVVVATQAGTVYRSMDGGSTWTFISSLPFGFMGPRTGFQLVQDQDGFVWMAGGYSSADKSYTQGDVYLSRDGGVNWYVSLPQSIVSLSGAPRLRYANNSCLGISYTPSTVPGSATIKQVILYGGTIADTAGNQYSSVSLAVTAPIAAVTGVWAFCGVVQSANFYSITSALLTTNSTTSLTYKGATAFYAVAGSTCSGSRSFYNLTQGATPVLQQTATITALANPGSTGGNTNFFYPYQQPELDGDGLTFTFGQIPLIDGEPNTAAGGASTSMNFWFTNGEYDEETQGGTHESVPWTSSLSIVPVPVGTTAYPTCAPAPTTQFLFCYYLVTHLADTRKAHHCSPSWRSYMLSRLYHSLRLAAMSRCRVRVRVRVCVCLAGELDVHRPVLGQLHHDRRRASVQPDRVQRAATGRARCASARCDGHAHIHRPARQHHDHAERDRSGQQWHVCGQWQHAVSERPARHRLGRHRVHDERYCAHRRSDINRARASVLV